MNYKDSREPWSPEWCDQIITYIKKEIETRIKKVKSGSNFLGPKMWFIALIEERELGDLICEWE